MNTLHRSPEWIETPLSKLVTLDREGVAPDLIEKGSKYVGLEHIGNDGHIRELVSVERGQLASNKFRFTSAHVLYGKLRPNLMKIARPGFEGICSTDILPLLPGAEVDRDYLYHFLRSPSVVAKATSLATGANLPRLSPKALLEFAVRYPRDLSEQRRIAAILDKADALRRKAQQALDLTDDLIRSTFLDMFGDPVTNPKGWPEKGLESFCRPRQWKTIPGKDLLEDGFPVYSANGQVGFYSDFNHAEPVVTIGCRGTCGAIHVTPPKCWVTGNAMCLDDLDRKAMTQEFLEWVLKLRGVREAITGTATPQITRESLRAVSVITPPVGQQNPFADFLRVARASSVDRVHQLEEAQSLFDSCLQNAFAGGL